jgi:hypothetical protein
LKSQGLTGNERQMKLISKISIIFFLSAMLFSSETAHAAISIAVTGSWYESIDKNDLVSGAGSDLQSTYTSVSGQVSIDISDTTGADDTWRVEIKKADTNWDANLHVHVIRTSDGSGGSVSGGGSYQEVTNIDTPFFTGDDDVTGINIQLRMTGASVQTSPDSYSTALYYTVIDTE